LPDPASSCADVGRILTLTNRRLADEIPSDFFVTLLLARLDPRTASLVHANAGHCPGFVLDHRGQLQTVLPSCGMPLGIDRECEYPTSAPVSLHPGDLVLLYSDGIVEARSPRGQPFGVEHMLDVVRGHRQEPSDVVLDTLMQAVLRFSQPSAQLDDLTAVVIKAE
jgi:sigma-B regulation protein RsbU (phosphoserine phosphatase)